MHSSESVSLCFLTYNRQSVVRRCFKSMKADFEDELIEKIIWDNASTDGTAEWLRELVDLYPNTRVMLAGDNYGVAGGRKAMFPLARGDVIISLDSDVVATDVDWKQPLLDGLQDANVGLVGPAGHYLRLDWSLKQAPGGVHNVDILSGYCHAFRRGLLGGVSIDTNFNYAGVEDDDFCLQVAHLGLSVQQVDVPLQHRFSGTWSTGAQAYMDNRRRLRRKWETLRE